MNPTGRVLSLVVQCVCLVALAGAASAQDDLFITVSAPASGAASSAAAAGEVFTTVSAPAAARPAPAAGQPAPKPAAAPSPAPAPAAASAAPAASAAETFEKWAQEPLRDPFWPIGFFPEGWKKKSSAQGGAEVDSTGWKVASAKIQISGTSRLGGRTAAIVNGQLKGVGEMIEVTHEGKVYQWQIVGIDGEGRVQLKKQVIK